MGAEKKEQTMDVGIRLRELRQERGLSMRSLARLSGLSTNALSMIERGRTSPSVSTLYKLSEALEIPITAFFRTEPPRQAIVFRKAGERSRVKFQRGLWEGLGGESFIGRVEPFMLTLQGGATSGPHGLVHTGHEFVICLEGQLEYEVEEERFSLDLGDRLLFATGGVIQAKVLQNCYSFSQGLNSMNDQANFISVTVSRKRVIQPNEKIK